MGVYMYKLLGGPCNLCSLIRSIHWILLCSFGDLTICTSKGVLFLCDSLGRSIAPSAIDLDPRPHVFGTDLLSAIRLQRTTKPALDFLFTSPAESGQAFHMSSALQQPCSHPGQPAALTEGKQRRHFAPPSAHP